MTIKVNDKVMIGKLFEIKKEEGPLNGGYLQNLLHIIRYE